MTPRSMRGDDGFIAGSDALIFGVLIFVIGSLMLTNLWSMINARATAEHAAREATRAAVEAPTLAAMQTRATDAATTTWTTSGPPRTTITTTLTGDIERCGAITVTTTATIPLTRLPIIGWTAGTTTVTATHTELVDPYRASLPGSATCPT
jgi:Flp pilus assembly protein TadG